MKIEQAKALLSETVKLAVSADERGDVVMRGQHLKTIEDLPLPVPYVRAALEEHGLLSIYRGPK